jgi:hypothetical protein
MEDLRVVSLAKQREEVFLPGESQPIPTEAEQPVSSCYGVCGMRRTDLP